MQVPETELVDMVDPEAKPKMFPGDTCGKTPPVGFQYVPNTGFEPSHRFLKPYMDHHQDLSKVLRPPPTSCVHAQLAE